MKFRFKISYKLKNVVWILSLVFFLTICSRILLLKKVYKSIRGHISDPSTSHIILNQFGNDRFSNHLGKTASKHTSTTLRTLSEYFPDSDICPGYNTSNITICQIFYGRLGNNMFTYAANWCFAKKYGFRLVIPNFLEVVRIFKLSEETIDYWKLRDFCKGSERHMGFFETTFIYEYFNISCTRNFIIDGYLQSFLNFMDCEDDIRKEFVFRENLKEKADRSVSVALGRTFCFDCKSRNISLIAVHARREDYVKYDYPMPNVKYYDEARNYFRDRLKNVRFVVVTSPDKTSRAWCLHNLIANTSDTFLLPENAVEIDMFILIHSDHVIISTGTFGWWGAWLNKKATVVKWNNLHGDNRWNASDFYPSHWILLDGPGLGYYKHYKKWISV